MWNLGEPQLVRMEPLCGTLWNLNFSEWNLYSSQTRTLRARCQACCADTRVRKTTTRRKGSPTQKAPGATPKAAALRTGGPRRSPAIQRRANKVAGNIADEANSPTSHRRSTSATEGQASAHRRKKGPKAKHMTVKATT